MNKKNEEVSVPVINRHVFVPHYLGVLSNAYLSSQSRLFLDRYGCGINEVRLLTALAYSPGLSAAELCDALAMNKSIVSRSLSILQEKGLIEAKSRGKRFNFELTASGLILNAKIVPISLEREQLLLAGFSETDRVILLGYLARMQENIANIQEAGAEI
jgi:DNA-binding MarR family transcriptional regulator